MSYRTQLSGYVKFLRGTPAAWESIITKDPDTLYFIAEPNDTSGKLYLGNKLISGGGSGSSLSISDLEDVLIGANVPSNAVLLYNSTSNIWEPASLATAIAQVVAVMTGATASSDGLAGLVPQPLLGQQGLFLRGDGTWANPTAAVESSLAALRGSDTTGTIREIAIDAINGLLEDAPENLDTLQELAQWIANHEEEFNFASDIQNVTDSLFGTLAEPEESISDLVNMVQEDGVIRILSNLQTLILGDGQETTGLISDLNSFVTAADGRMDTIEADIDAIDARLKWSDLVEEEENNNGE